MSRDNKIKIGYLTVSEWWGGGLMSLISLLEGLDYEKYQPIVISVISKKTKGFENFAKEINRLKVEHIVLKKFIFINEGSPRILRGLFRPLSLIFNIVGTYNVIKKNKLDIVHSYDGYSNIYGSIATKLANLPYVYTVHLEADLDFTGIPWRFKSLVDLADKIIPTCFDFLKVANNKSYDLTKFVPIHTGVRDYSTYVVEDSELKFSSGYKIPENDCLLIALIGRVTEQKGHRYLIEATKNLIKINSSIQILLVGSLEDDRNYVLELRELIDINKLHKNVYLTGYCSHMELLMKRIDILALPSLYESVPMVVLEAMQASKAVVASNVGGISEAVVDFETGFLFPVGNSEMLGSCLARLVCNKELRVEMGKKGYEKTLSKFSLKKMAAAHEDVYLKICKK